MKVFEMFAGYGGASWGLRKAGINFQFVGYSEINKGAIKCYEKNFPKVNNFGDCTKIQVQDLPDFDLLTGGFPCQDVSNAGKRDLSKGRTNLYREVIRIAEAKKPQYILLENVKGLVSMEVNERKLIHQIASDLRKIGYDVLYKLMNSKDFGTPQDRSRIWIVCKRGKFNFMEFQFPEEEKLYKNLKVMLEDNIPVDRLEFKKSYEVNLNKKSRDKEEALFIANELSKKYDAPIQIDIMHLQYGEIRPLSTYIPQDFRIHRCLQTGEPKEVLIYKGTKRKLTPKECFRLMGFFEDEINLESLSKSEAYFLAGNGWDVNLVSKIFRRMFE